MKKLSILTFIIFLFQICSFAQTKNDDVTKDLNKQSFEEFGVSKDSIKKNLKILETDKPKTGSSAADLNSGSELLKLKNKKDSSVITNKEALKEKVENNDADLFSTTPVIKGQTNKTDNKINYNSSTTETATKQKTTVVEQKKVVEQKIDKVEKPVIKKVEQPIKVEKKIEPTINDKGTIKDFSFDTQPIIKQNGKTVAVEKAKVAEITAPKEYKEKQPNEMNKKELEEYNWKKNYNDYQREADSIRYKNKMWLDSVLATMKTDAPIFIDPNDYIEIYVSGGGLNGGVNPKEYDRTTILTTGVIQREYKPKMQDMIRVEKKITRAELLTLAQYIVDMGFFKYDEYYECADDDIACEQRMNQYPTPIPLTVVVAVGVRRNTVNVDFYNPKIDKNWVNYPANLEKILDAIFSVVDK